MKKAFDFKTFGANPEHTIKLGGYTYLQWKPRWSWLMRFKRIVEWLYRPEVKHEPTKVMLFKKDGIYELSLNEEVESR